LKAAVAGTGGAAAATVALTAGLSLFATAVLWYASWWVETHTAYQLSARLGGRTVSFVIEKPKSLLDTERLVFIVDGRRLGSWRIVRGWLMTQASLLDGNVTASFGDVRVSCARYVPPEFDKDIFKRDIHASAAVMVLCTVEVEQRELAGSRTVRQPVGSGYVRVCRYEGERVYAYTWRVRVDLLGLKEVQPPTRVLKTTTSTERCWYEYYPSSSYYSARVKNKIKRVIPTLKSDPIRRGGV